MATVKPFPISGTRFYTKPLEQPLVVENDVEKRIQAVVLRDRIRIREFFHDFDNLRKGTVGEGGFRSAINGLKIILNTQEMNDLVAKYKNPATGLIEYRRFCDNIDTVFFDQKEATTTAQKARSEGVSENLKQIFSEEEKQLLFETISAIQQTVKANRILMKPTFQDFDRTHCLHVSSAQFSRVLKQLALLPQDDTIVALLVRFYLDRNNPREVNYVRFCQDVDKPEFMFGKDYNKPLPPRIVSTPTQNASRAQPAHFKPDETAGLDILQNRFLKQRVDISHDPDDIEKRLQGLVLMRRIRIHEFFHDNDKLRKGVVTETQFRRVLSMLKLEFTDLEFKQLVAKYQKGQGFVNYMAFCDNIDSVFTVKNLEKDPNKRVKMPSESDTLIARQKHLLFSQDEQQTIMDVVKGYQRAVIQMRILLKPMFQDFDVPNIGYVSKTQFLRVLHQLGVYAPPAFENLILKLYMDRGNADDVNYIRFCADVDCPEDIFGVGQDFNQKGIQPLIKTAARVVGGQIVNNAPVDVNDVMARIRRIVKQERVRIKEFLADFDKLRSGSITVNQLRKGLKMGKIELSEAEFQAIINHYASSTAPNSIRYTDFCEDIEAVFTRPRLEKDPMKTVGKGDESRTQTFYGIAGPSANERDLANSVVERFRAHLVRLRLQSKTFFQEWDRHNKQKVTPKQFRQVLATLGFHLTEAEFIAVQKCFGAVGTENDTGYIEYLKFLGDSSQGLPDGTGSVTATVGQLIVQPKAPERKSFSLSYGITRKPITDINLLLQDLKRYIKINRIRLREFFQDHDPLRKGFVTQAKFRTVMNSQKVDLADEEFELLEREFKKEGTGGEKLVNYIQLDQDIETVFTQKGIERDPLYKVNEFHAPPYLDPNDVLNNDEEKVVHDCLTRMGVFVKDHRLLLKPHFQDKDRAKGGFVANTRFRQILDFHKLQLTDYEYELLCRRFRARATNEINYVDFDNLLRRYSGDIEPF